MKVCLQDLVGQRESRLGERDDSSPAIRFRYSAADKTSGFESVDAFGDCARRDDGEVVNLARVSFIGWARSAKRQKYAEFALADPVAADRGNELVVDEGRQSVQTSDQAEGKHIEFGSLACPFLQDAVNAVAARIVHSGSFIFRGSYTVLVTHTLRWTMITALAPIVLGTAYYVTQAYLPAEYPLYGSAIRALPAGLLLLLIGRRIPRGEWWWKSLVLGALNFGVFFALIYIASQLLPSGIASTLMAAGPLVTMLLAWPILAERPRALGLAGGALGMTGVVVMLFTGTVAVNPWGVLASAGALLSTTVGLLLTKRWKPPQNVMATTSWQMLAGGFLLLVLAVIVEGPPPTLNGTELVAFGYLSLIATGFSFCIWFSGLRRLSAGTVGLLGLLTPVTGTLVGVLAAGENFGINQLFGMILVFVGIIAGQPMISERLKRRKLTVAARPRAHIHESAVAKPHAAEPDTASTQVGQIEPLSR